MTAQPIVCESVNDLGSTLGTRFALSLRETNGIQPILRPLCERRVSRAGQKGVTSLAAPPDGLLVISRQPFTDTSNDQPGPPTERPTGFVTPATHSSWLPKIRRHGFGIRRHRDRIRNRRLIGRMSACDVASPHAVLLTRCSAPAMGYDSVTSLPPDSARNLHCHCEHGGWQVQALFTQRLGTSATVRCEAALGLSTAGRGTRKEVRLPNELHRRRTQEDDD